MKKTLTIMMIMVLTLALGFSQAYAVTSFKIALSANTTRVAQGGEVVVTVNLQNFKANETGINTIGGEIDYDKTIFDALSTASFKSENGWDTPTFNPQNGQFIMTNSSFKTENHTLMQITLKVKDTAALGNTTITIKDVNAADGMNDIYPEDASITLTIVTPTTSSSSSSKSSSSSSVKSSSTSSSATKMPSTGVVDYILPTIGVVAVLGVVAFIRYNRIEK